MSGRTGARPGYQQMLHDASIGRFECILVSALDRFGRNVREAVTAIEELHELGIVVISADAPDRNHQTSQGRFMMNLSLSLAQLESDQTGERTSQAMRERYHVGQWPHYAPEGYINAEMKVGRSYMDKLSNGGYVHWIEIDPQQSKIIRQAFDMMLQENNMTYREICEVLHASGYTTKLGTPYIKIMPDGKREPNKGALNRYFNNWFYAGWLTTKRSNTYERILPKTIRGLWDPIVTTEEFEQAQRIRAARQQNRKCTSKRFFLLQNLLYLEMPQRQVKAYCSRPNSGRGGGGTPYYEVRFKGYYRFRCEVIDQQIAGWMHHIQVDPQHLPAIRAATKPKSSTMPSS